MADRQVIKLLNLVVILEVDLADRYTF